MAGAQLCYNHDLILIRNCISINGIDVSKALKKILSPEASWESIPYKYIIGPFGIRLIID